MYEIILDKTIKNQYDSLPQGWTWFLLKSGTAELYSGYTANLKSRISFLRDKATEGGPDKEMWDKANRLSWQSCDNSMQALILYKCMLQESSPEYQYRLLPYRDYAYLGLNSTRFPFISIQEHTQDDWLYLGPFRSRFFLADVIDTYARILKLPACETGTYPCEKFDSESCRGWCLHLAPGEESSHEHNLEKLDSLLKEAFVHPNNGILELLENERQAYFNDLEFEKASLLDDEIELLKKYKDWLAFLYVAKKLEIAEQDFKVQQGRLVWCRLNGKEHHFAVDNTEYRDIESLALNLDAVDEQRIIYEYVRKNRTDKWGDNYAQ